NHPVLGFGDHCTCARALRPYAVGAIPRPSDGRRYGEPHMERYGGGPIVVADYNPAWPALFEQERAKLDTALGSLVVTIEHVGSTAVPGLAAKPIIDLLVGVRSLEEARSRHIEVFQSLSYTYLPEYQSWLPDELFFRKGVPGPWTHHVHVMEPTNPGW